MDIILCEPSLSYKGGAQRVVLEIAKKYAPVIYTLEFDKNAGFPEFADFDVRIIPASGPSAIFRGIFGFDKRVMLSAVSGWAFFNYKMREDYDLISAGVVPSEWIRNRNERVCWYCHSPVRMAVGEPVYDTLFDKKNARVDVAVKAYAAVEKAIAPKIEKICTNSPISKARIEKLLGRRDVEIIYPAVSHREFSCKRYEKYFLYVSRLAPEKRIEFSIQAFKKFARKGWKLKIAGFLSSSLRDQMYFDFLKGLAKSSDIEFILGPDDAVLKRLYSHCYATLFSAVMEDWGIVPLESMSSCKPCISVNEGGPTISIVDGKTGFLINSIGEMAEKMKFLADHPDICEQMGKAGRKRVEQNYTWGTFMRKMERAFKETAKI